MDCFYTRSWRRSSQIWHHLWWRCNIDFHLRSQSSHQDTSSIRAGDDLSSSQARLRLQSPKHSNLSRLRYTNVCESVVPSLARGTSCTLHGCTAHGTTLHGSNETTVAVYGGLNWRTDLSSANSSYTSSFLTNHIFLENSSCKHTYEEAMYF